MNRYQHAVKRLFDILLALPGIALLWPLALGIALCIKAGSRGPVFFVQQRVGRGGKLFWCCKFRTMSRDAQEGGTVTTARDARITPVGRVLRRTKLDELPQLWNVLIGEMSFVGPRPDVPGYADRLQGEDREILELRPGITGPATLHFRNEEELLAGVPDPRVYNDCVIWPRKVALNREYLRRWSLRRDIGYLFSTVVGK